MSDGFSYDPHDHDEDWPLLEDCIVVRWAGKAWPDRLAAMDLRWHLVERWLGRMRARDFPTVRSFAAKWNWKPDRAASFIANTARWQTDPRRRMGLDDLRGDRALGVNLRRRSDGEPTVDRRGADGEPTPRAILPRASTFSPITTEEDPRASDAPLPPADPAATPPDGVTMAGTKSGPAGGVSPPPRAASLHFAGRELPPDLPALLFGVRAGRVDAVAALLNAGIDDTAALLRVSPEGWRYLPRMAEPVRHAIEAALAERWGARVGQLAPVVPARPREVARVYTSSLEVQGKSHAQAVVDGDLDEALWDYPGGLDAYKADCRAELAKFFPEAAK